MAKRCKRLMQVKYEVLGGRHGDLESLKQRFLEERLHIIPTETKATTSSKQDRIEQRLVGHFHAGVILMPRSYFYRSEYDGKIYDFIQQYKLEYLQFPFCEHDDILDCHSQLYEEMGELIRGRKPAEAKTEKKWGTADDWEQLYKEMDNYQFENPFLTRERAMDLLRLKRFRETLRKVTA
jgi:integrase